MTDIDLKAIQERAEWAKQKPYAITAADVDRAALLEHIARRGAVIDRLTEEKVELVDERDAAESKLARREARHAEVVRMLTEALGPDASGRDFADLLDVAHDELITRGGGPLADCLRLKAGQIRAALKAASESGEGA